MNESSDGTRCSGDSLLWCLGQINVARHKLVKLRWSTLNVVWGKKKNLLQDLMSKSIKEKKNATPEQCSFFTLYSGAKLLIHN